MSYPGHSLEESYSSAEMQLVYSTAPADWAWLGINSINMEYRTLLNFDHTDSWYIHWPELDTQNSLEFGGKKKKKNSKQITQSRPEDQTLLYKMRTRQLVNSTDPTDLEKERVSLWTLPIQQISEKNVSACGLYRSNRSQKRTYQLVDFTDPTDPGERAYQLVDFTDPTDIRKERISLWTLPIQQTSGKKAKSKINS